MNVKIHVFRDKSSSPSKPLARLASTDDSMVESTDDDVDSSDVDAGTKAEKEAAQLEELGKRAKMMMADFKVTAVVLASQIWAQALKVAQVLIIGKC